MNNSVKHLFEVASKETKVILGLMSGTSLDGLDLALCRISGSGKQTALELCEFKTIAYPEKVVQKLKSIVSVEEVSLQELCILNSWLGDYHAKLILETLNEWKIKPKEVDCIASHGQTVYHAPASKHQQEEMPNATLQIGDGDHIALRTGILAISDFRQKHTAAGGEGAPMAAFVDKLLFNSETQDRVLLNIGGIANFTFLPKEETELQSLTTDTGPGNTLINRAAQRYFNKPYDKDGEIAKRGAVHPKLLKCLLDHPFFTAPLPKSTGPESFSMQWVRKQQETTGTENISGEDLIATLTLVSAQTIADALERATEAEIRQVYLSGGGMYNIQLINWLVQLLDIKIHSFEEIGFNPDAKEAVCFAVLANETLSGKTFTINTRQNVERNVNFGKISLPL